MINIEICKINCLVYVILNHYLLLILINCNDQRYVNDEFRHNIHTHINDFERNRRSTQKLHSIETKNDI